ncbi:hypothetical protein GCM10027030_23220 [Luteococcus sediminum]
MMGIQMWTRACWKFLVPAMLAVQVFCMLNAQSVDSTSLPAWALDWSWMLSLWSGGTLLLSPVAAAAVVLLIHRAWRDPVDALVGGLARAPRSRLDILAAVYLMGVAVQAVTLALGSALCVIGHANATGVTLPWQLLTGPAALLAAVCLGGVIGEYWKDPWAVPVTAIAIFLSQNVFYAEGYPELLATEAAGWFMTGYRPIPGHLAATVAANILMAVGCLCLQMRRVPIRALRRHFWWMVAICCFVGIGAVFEPSVARQAVDTYEEIR